MSAATQARWPSVPADVSTLTDPDAATNATLDAAVHQAVLEFAATAGRVDGTRSAQVAWWAKELERVADRAWAEHVDEQNAEWWSE